MTSSTRQNSGPITGNWKSKLARFAMGAILFEALSGLAITLFPFHASIQWSVLVHTLVGAITLFPLGWYLVRHWSQYRTYAASHVTVLGYLGLVSLLVCAFSGVALTWEGLFKLNTSSWLRQVHLVTTLISLGAILPHVLFSWLHARRQEPKPAALAYTF